MVNFGIMLALLMGVGVLLAIRSKASRRSSGLRWAGYAVMLMTVFLIIVAILAKLGESAHYE